MIFSNDCAWHDQLEHIKKKAWIRVHVMRKLKFKLDRRSLQTIYISLIRPLLEYADIVWDNCNQTEAYELEKIQYEAARIVTGATKLVSINVLLSETGCETLAARRKKKHKLHLFFKMVNALSPEYLVSLVPPTVSSLTLTLGLAVQDLDLVFYNIKYFQVSKNYIWTACPLLDQLAKLVFRSHYAHSPGMERSNGTPSETSRPPKERNCNHHLQRSPYLQTRSDKSR